jgi:hypothetical protein
MKVLEVIESKVWVNKKTGLRVSPYGACPWTSEADRINWTLETVGYTWRNDNGTIGLGRVPAKTREEAIEVMEKVNARSR